MAGLDDRVMLQRELAELLGVSQEHLSRVLAAARRQGRRLPPQAVHPVSGRPGWRADAFVAWWRRRRPVPSGPPPLLTRAMLLRDVAAGLDAQGIAAKRGTLVRTVRRAADRAGVVVPDRWERHRTTVLALAEQGAGVALIAARTGLPYSSVRRYVRDWRAGSGDVAAGEPPRGVW